MKEVVGVNKLLFKSFKRIALPLKDQIHKLEVFLCLTLNMAGLLMVMTQGCIFSWLKMQHFLAQ